MKRVGIIGCGEISNIYMNNISRYFHGLTVVACADIDPNRARLAADRHGIAKACSAEELLADADIDVILNLTVPKVHYEINRQALLAGKHVYCEKPMALSMDQVEELQRLSREGRLALGCAPDTFLGPALQTCRKLIDDGWIGRPVAAVANMVSHGHETWHPNPDFFYQKGGGPMMDMGPYYISALVSMLGPVLSTSCFCGQGQESRRIYTRERYGQEIPVEVPTHYAGILKFRQGTIASLNMSFDVWLSHLPKLEIYGTEGTLVVPDPNRFDGEVKLLRADSLIKEVDGKKAGEAAGMLSRPEMWEHFKSMPRMFGRPAENMRGLGLADLAGALEAGREHRTNPEFTGHITEVLLSFEKAQREGVQHMRTTCARPEPIKL